MRRGLYTFNWTQTVPGTLNTPYQVYRTLINKSMPMSHKGSSSLNSLSNNSNSIQWCSGQEEKGHSQLNYTYSITTVLLLKEQTQKTTFPQSQNHTILQNCDILTKKKNHDFCRTACLCCKNHQFLWQKMYSFKNHNYYKLLQLLDFNEIADQRSFSRNEGTCQTERHGVYSSLM